MENREILLEAKHISKYFATLAANDDISFKLHTGEVLALLGENGAGKSTLMNIIYGIYKPNNGEIFIRGQKAKISSVADAMSNGIGMVHQHFMLVGRFNAIENVALMIRESGLRFINKKKIKERLTELKDTYGIDVDLDCPVEQLSISMQQKIEILKLLYTGADILILDEPTAVLLPQECEALFAIIRKMQQNNKGVIFISHKLDEVLNICQRITVLKHGKVTGEVMASDVDKKAIIKMMSDTDLQDIKHVNDGITDKPLKLKCQNIKAFDERGVQVLNGVDLSAFSGEIVGIAGVEGNGQLQLADVMAGILKPADGFVEIDGEKMGNNPASFIDKHVGYIHEDRNKSATVSDFPLYENWLLRKKDYPKKNGLTDINGIIEQVKQAMERFDVRTGSHAERSANLSGGNLQKFILARELESNPEVLICCYPTRGLDIKASYFVREQIVKAKEAGAAVILFSSDMDELFTLSDRILVMYRGKVVAERVNEETNPEEIAMLMMRGEI